MEINSLDDLEKAAAVFNAQVKETVKAAKQMWAQAKPRWEHDCLSCVFIGQIQEYDLYICNSTILARYGDLPEEYNSGPKLRLKNLTIHFCHFKCLTCGKETYGLCHGSASIIDGELRGQNPSEVWK